MRVENLRLKVIGLIAFTAICLLTLVYLFQAAGGRLRLSDPYNAKALVPDALNIVQNSDVRRDGVTVGRVRDIRSRSGVSEVSFELEKEGQQQLFRDATVRVRTKTLVGESYLDVDPGSPSSGELPSGATIPLEAAAETVPLERILSTLDGPTRREVRRNLDGIGGGLSGHGTDLNELFGALEPTVASSGKLLRALEPQKRELARLVDNFGEVFIALGERTAALRGLITDAKTTADAAASRDEQLRASLDELPGTLQRARSTVDRLASFSSTATPVVRELKLATRDLAPAVRDLAPAARDARVLFKELTPFLRKVDPLLTQLKPASGKLRAVVGPLDAFIRQLDPTVGFLKGFSTEIGTWFANTGSITTAVDAYGAKGRVFAMVGPNQFTSYPKEVQRVMDAFLKEGLAQQLYRVRMNPHPKPGSLNDLQDFDGSYPNVAARK